MAEKIATRHAYGEALAEIGSDPKIVALDADVSSCTMSCMFAQKYPERFFNMGIAEANMIGAAAGLSTYGFTPFVHAFAMFAAGRAFEQVRNSICYPNLNVKCVGTHGGLSVGEDGATHQCVEDIALMRAIPNMTVICPADANETRAAVHAIAAHEGPVYLRLGRVPVETVTDFPGYQFTIGKSVTLREGTDLTIIATGMVVADALAAAEELEKEGIHARVIDMHTIKPIDREAIRKAAKETGAIVTAEEHNILGGLGGAVAEVVCADCPVPVERVGVKDCFGRSGNAQALLELYGVSKSAIVSAARTVLKR